MDLGWQALDHLTAGDLQWISGVINQSGEAGPVEASDLLARPAILDRWLEDPRLVQAWCAVPAETLLQRLSPFLCFWIALLRTSRDLAHASAVQEWVGPRQRLYLFDVEPLRQFAQNREDRLFLAELLASFTRVESGVVRVRQGSHWRRIPYSELDPWHLLQLLEVADPSHKVWLYRRLGDLALFLTGVFPDHVGGFSPAAARRWRRTAQKLGVVDALDGDSDRLGLFEQLGQRAYAAAVKLAPASYPLRMVDRMARSFRTARRVLNLAADRYLLPQRRFWFPMASG